MRNITSKRTRKTKNITLGGFGGLPFKRAIMLLVTLSLCMCILSGVMMFSILNGLLWIQWWVAGVVSLVIFYRFLWRIT